MDVWLGHSNVMTVDSLNTRLLPRYILFLDEKASKQGRQCALIVECGRKKEKKNLLLFKNRGGKSGGRELMVM